MFVEAEKVICVSAIIVKSFSFKFPSHTYNYEYPEEKV